MKPWRSPAPRRQKDLLIRDCRAVESLSRGDHASLRPRGGDVPSRPVQVLPEGPAARRVGAGERLCPTAAQLLRRPFWETEGHNQSCHLSSSQFKVGLLHDEWSLQDRPAGIHVFWPVSQMGVRWQSAQAGVVLAPGLGKMDRREGYFEKSLSKRWKIKSWKNLREKIMTRKWCVFFLPDSSPDQTRVGVSAAPGETELRGDTRDPPPGLFYTVVWILFL